MAKGALRNVGPNQTPEYRTASSRKRPSGPKIAFSARCLQLSPRMSQWDLADTLQPTRHVSEGSLHSDSKWSVVRIRSGKKQKIFGEVDTTSWAQCVSHAF